MLFDMIISAKIFSKHYYFYLYVYNFNLYMILDDICLRRIFLPRTVFEIYHFIQKVWQLQRFWNISQNLSDVEKQHLQNELLEALSHFTLQTKRKKNIRGVQNSKTQKEAHFIRNSFSLWIIYYFVDFIKWILPDEKWMSILCSGQLVRNLTNCLSHFKLFEHFR